MVRTIIQVVAGNIKVMKDIMYSAVSEIYF